LRLTKIFALLTNKAIERYVPLNKIKHARLKAKRDYSASVRKLLDEIQWLLLREGKTIADLAREINRSYDQTYAWVERRRFNPGPIGVNLLTQWRDNVVRETCRSSQQTENDLTKKRT
jgi:hypothetical protein